MKRLDNVLWLATLAVIVATVFGVALSPVACLPTSPNAAPSPQAKLAMARDTFNATVNALADLREQGHFTDEQCKAITGLIAAGSVALDLWEAAISRGAPPEARAARFLAIMADLAAIHAGAGGGGRDG